MKGGDRTVRMYVIICKHMNKVCLLSPLRSPVCSQDTGGYGGHIWGCVLQEAFRPDRPRVSSCGGPTPGPSCPSVGCIECAGALRREQMVLV